MSAAAVATMVGATAAPATRNPPPRQAPVRISSKVIRSSSTGATPRSRSSLNAAA
jgi:hypothetical protein